ncbi:hypothetical protein H5410_035468 [Solanum commersonii]|uniref:SET domain-containing protein n=1 Tax=Solanum commersonii TaxID=4109 RepID=A0A9J5Y4R9_SOLCO|nr:hypothetical protein H5410_035468 [Solanum commersonii]
MISIFVQKRFQKCEYAKTKLFRTEGRGWGLLADKNIMAYESHDLKDMYIIYVDGNDFIDSTWKGSFARFINHSCSPNCETGKWIVLGETKVGIFAKQDISVGMELTYEYNFEWSTTNVWEDGDDRYIVDDLPVYDLTDDESTLVISGTSGGNEHTKILNDGEASTFKLEPTNSAAKKSQRKPKLKDVSRCEQCPNDIREEMKKYVDVKKEQKRQALLQKDVTNTSDDKDEDMEEGEATE